MKANQKIEYSHWDAESQCAEDISADNMQALQKQFTNQKSSIDASGSKTEDNKPMIDEQTQDAIVKELVQALLQFFLQFIK